MINPFFKNHGPFKIKKIIDIINNNSQLKKENFKVYDIKDLILSTSKDITFFTLRNIPMLHQSQKLVIVLQLIVLSTFYQKLVLQ